VDPALQEKIEAFLRTVDLQQLQADRDAGNYEIFKNPLFAHEGNEPGGADKIAIAWKKVCSKKEFSKQSALLAELRWKMLVDVFAQVAADRGIKIELIDSGKRNAYRSDIDLTVYSPEDQRGSHTLASIIREGADRIKEVTGGREAATFDVTIHNGDLFVPNIRNSEQSVAEYSRTLRDVVGLLRLKVTSGGDASYFPGAHMEDVQKRGMRDAIVTELAPELEIVRRAPDGTVLETRYKKPVPKELHATELGANGEIISNSSRFGGEPLPYDKAADSAIWRKTWKNSLETATSQAIWPSFLIVD